MAGIKHHPGTLYDYTAGAAVGVLVEDSVMRKLAKEQAAHLERVRRILEDSKDKVYPSMWTLHYPDGEQTVVKFIDTSVSVDERISSALKGPEPRPAYPVFYADSMEEAREKADAYYEETGIKA